MNRIKLMSKTDKWNALTNAITVEYPAFPSSYDYRNLGKETINQEQFEMGASAHFVYDVMDECFLYVDKNIYQINGFTSEEIMKDPMNYITSSVADEHAMDMAAFTKKAFKMSEEELDPFITYNIEYDSLTKTGKRKRVIVQFRVKQRSAQNKPLLTVGKTTDISYLSHINSAPRFFVLNTGKITHKETGTYYKNIRQKMFNLSKKELEIIDLIDKGHSNQEISAILFLSLSTVYTHRRNIKQKTGINITALISRLKESGVI